MTVAEGRAPWVERPLEPVVTRGVGMRVLGFVTALAPAKPLRPKESSDDKENAAESAPAGVPQQSSNKRKFDGTVAGPGYWKRNKPVYLHGNYRGYYRRRDSLMDGQATDRDRRVTAVLERLGEDVFASKEVLDIGCNAGRVALDISLNLGASRVVGIDIDAGLIQEAEQASVDLPAGSVEFRAEDILKSPLKRPPAMKPERFDVILCLSLTKWIHFAEGDTGIRNLLKRCYKRLRRGGLLVLEPQGFETYKKRRYMTPEIREMVRSIQLRPEDFGTYLEELGFHSEGVIEPSWTNIKGFKRFIYLHRKPAAVEEETAPLEEQ
mmetsp:Transcript_69313/g.166187  ORF Transcript_69313/g.166187 Transcript_69313/m.166187 type:complete len:323 (+) Transcript_69313:69-1037(+)